MSEYVTKNTENSLQLFNRRTIYRSKLLNYNKNYIVNFFQGEKILYGRISRRFEPVVTAPVNLKPLQSADSNTALQAVNFVKDVFMELCVQFKKCAQAGSIDTTDPYLSNLKAYKAYTSPEKLYGTYRDIYYSSIASLFQKNQIYVDTFEEFIEALMPLLPNALATEPLTFPGFVKSNHCTVMSTGLAIEIADLKYYDDQEKINSLINSNNWEFFVNACNDYGFMIDLNVPWRIVADLNSELMKQQAYRYGHVSFVDTGFDSATVIYIKSFISELNRLYNTVRLPARIVSEVCKDGTVKQKTVTSQQYNTLDLVHKYPARYFLNLYLRIRLMEEQPQLSHEDVNAIVKAYTDSTIRSQSLSSIIHGFESAINKTFDKSGSLSYISKQIRAQAEAAFARGDIDNLNVDFSGDIEVSNATIRALDAIEVEPEGGIPPEPINNTER